MSADDSRNVTAPGADEDARARTLAALQSLPERFRKILVLREVRECR
jgi:DNA-directed RNA polymerase specialized sigma24 family protein